jgi:hypothetical protein
MAVCGSDTVGSPDLAQGKIVKEESVTVQQRLLVPHCCCCCWRGCREPYGTCCVERPQLLTQGTQ